MRFARIVGTLASIAVLCVACGHAPSHAGTSSAPPSSAPAATRVVPTTTAPASSGDVQATFCATARRLGVRDLGLAASDADAAVLLPNLDTLNAVAPAAIRADFNRFVGVEHVLLDPSHPQASTPGDLDRASTGAAIQHVQSYLHSVCALP